jgi:dTDP-4-amino-4,6-dideoxygalactose transaminase
MRAINYDQIMKKRISNYEYLDFKLGGLNNIKISRPDQQVPMVYPLLLNRDANFIRNELINKNIYIAKYWDEVLSRLKINDFEISLVNNLLPIPIDQRYSIGEMEFIIKTLNSLL